MITGIGERRLALCVARHDRCASLEKRFKTAGVSSLSGVHQRAGSPRRMQIRVCPRGKQTFHGPNQASLGSPGEGSAALGVQVVDSLRLLRDVTQQRRISLATQAQYDAVQWREAHFLEAVAVAEELLHLLLGCFVVCPAQHFGPCELKRRSKLSHTSQETANHYREVYIVFVNVLPQIPPVLECWVCDPCRKASDMAEGGSLRRPPDRPARL